MERERETEEKMQTEKAETEEKEEKMQTEKAETEEKEEKEEKEKTKSVVINNCYGGFGLSKEAETLYFEKTGKKWDNWQTLRHDPVLVQIVRELGVRANDKFAKLKIVDIPEDVDYEIQDYDGAEWISEKHRTWS